MAQEDAERIFEPFYQARRVQHGQHEGAGLGLSISKQFVALHGGRMWLTSDLGQGSTFSFELPIRPTDVASSGASRWLSEEWHWRQHRSAVPTQDARLDERYVVCEPSYDLLSTAQRYAPHWEFVPAGDVAQACERLAQAPAQAILCNAPDVERLLEALRKGLELISDTPLLGCTLDMGAGRERWAAISAYLVKPFRRADLEAAILQTIEHARQHLVGGRRYRHAASGLRLLSTCFPEATLHVAGDGQSALDLMREVHPDVLLLDVILPDMDGWEVVGVAQADPELADVPVVMVSAQDPMSGPPTSPYLLVAMPQGISVNRLLRCCQSVSRILLQPERSLRSETVSRPAPQ